MNTSGGYHPERSICVRCAHSHTAHFDKRDSKDMESQSRTLVDEASQQLSATERGVAELWSEVLQTDRVPSASDNFFSLGGDSMGMVTVEYRIKEEFSVELPPGALLGAPTLRELSALVDAACCRSRSL